MPKPTKKIPKPELIREAWLRGDLTYKLHAGQRLIRASINRSSYNQLFVGECARQFGKTILEAIMALEKAFSKPRAKVKIGTAFHTDLIEFILPAFEIVMGDCPQDLRPVWKSQQSKFVLPNNGSEIKLIGLDRKPNGLRGTVIDLIILSEAGFINNLHYLFKSVIIPATTHRPDCRVFMLSTPPDTPAHDFLDYVQKAEFEDSYIKLTIYQNPLVDQATIERLMKESGGPASTTWRREYLCEHITDANSAIISEWIEEYVQDVPRDHYFQFYHKYDAMDLGVKDNTCVIFGYYDFRRGKLIIDDEYSVNGPDLTTLILRDNIRIKEFEQWGSYPVYRRVSDNNNPLLLQDLSILHNLHFMPTDKATLVEMVNLVKMMVREGRIIVHSRCKQLKGCLKYGVWDSKRDKFAHSKVYGHFDALASLIYLCRNLDQVTNPVPPHFMTDPSNQIIFNRDINDSAHNLKRAFRLG